ncbi:LCP family protein [Actinomadura gamaensis]|uniref:LCP family protein n=1 Tax=Actinomadura gamaensis TaxID=1763541 RepID=A0ABV9U725_9ACTN
MSDKDAEREHPRADLPRDASAPGTPARSEGADAPGSAPSGDAPAESDASGLEAVGLEAGATEAGATEAEGARVKRLEQRKARNRKVIRWVAAGTAGALLIAGGVATWLYQDLRGNIRQEHVKDRLGENRPAKLNKSLNILLIGSDTREGENGRYGSTADISGARSDTTILLHLSPNRDQAVGISFPRDSMVQMPTCKRDKGADVPAHFGMINEAFAYAGPTCTWKTLESLTGIHIDHFVQVDFVGFKRMVDALGGVEICLDKPVDDPRAELHLKAGRQVVKGDDALGYVRARYSLGDGSDLERIQRQQKFMASVVSKATSSSMLTDPAKTYGFLKAATKSVTTDDELDLGTMKKIADGLKDMSAGQVRFVTVPVEPYAPDPNRVQWNQSQAKGLFQAVQHDNDLPAVPSGPPAPQSSGRPPAAGPPSATTKPPAKVRVTVVDAGAKPQDVTRIVQQLHRRGFDVQSKVEKGAAAQQTSLSYAPAAEGQATRLARIAPTAALTPDPNVPADTLRLTLGADGLQLLPPKAIDSITGGVKSDQNLCEKS